MNKKPLIAILISFLFLSAYYSEAHAGAFTVFGPKTYIREKGKPEKITETFNVRSVTGSYRLIVENGLYTETEEDDDDDGDEKKKGKDKKKDKEEDEKKIRVSFAEIEINGKEVIKEHDFNKRVIRVEKAVLLNHGNNIIEIEVKSSPGAFITVKIEGNDSVPPPVTIVSPANNVYLNTPSITVTGNASDSISWVESVKVNGAAAQLQNGSYTVSNINLIEGANTITVTATDAAGNIGSASITVNLDTIPPQITLDPVQPITNNPQFTITGMVSDASSIAAFTINGAPVSLTNNTFTTTLNLAEGSNTIAISATDKAGNTGSAAAAVLLDTAPPVIAISTPAGNTTLNTPSVTVTGTASDTSSGLSSISVNGVNAVISGDSYIASNIALAEGLNTITATAADMAGNTGASSLTITLDTTPPVIAITSPLDGSAVNTDTTTVAGTIDDNTAAVTVNGVNASVANNTFTASGVTLAQGANTITVTASDPVGNIKTASITITRTALEGIPPDPAAIAPQIDRTAAATLASATEFLYTGSNPIQTGVAPNTIEARRAAVLRGKVFTNDGSPLSGVKITVLNHTEFGSTLSRLDGIFDMAVNGGDWLTINYEKDGYLPVQRKVDAPWQDYVWLQDVVMIFYDSKVTAIDLNANTPIQSAQGNPVTDADGTRQATILFPQGTTAVMTLSDGATQTLTNLNVRATEYTVGENGPKAMPAELPPTSGYTYAVEFSVDEALSAGAKTVTFNQPLPFYVENFLNFPVGSIVPVGYYDREKGVWIPSDNGIIIKILNINNGLAELDIDGSGLPANALALTALGITDAERQKLAVLYQTGQSLWRMPITHFTPWDGNWPYGPPLDAKPPNQPSPKKNKPDDPTIECGSIIECQNQILGEAANITGSPVSLHYRSDRVQGYKPDNTIEIPLSGATVPSSLNSIVLEVYIAGNRFTKTFPALPNQTYTITWNGKDAYGRTLNNAQPVTTRIGYVYKLVYYRSADFERSFAVISGIPTTVRRDTVTITLWQQHRDTIGAWDARAQGLGAWTLDSHHFYDPVGRVLYLGDGERRSAQKIQRVITTLSGTGTAGYSGDGAPAVNAKLNYPSAVAVDGQGNIFVAEYNRIRKIGLDGIITTAAGTGVPGYSGDGGPAVNAKINSIWGGITVDREGNLLIADYNNHRIRKINSDGIITTIAGTGTSGYSGDGGPAVNAQLSYPYGVAVDREGNLFIADYNNHRIRKINPDGIITTIAGSGTAGYGGDGGPAINAKFTPMGIAVDREGNLFIVDSPNHRIRKVGADGIITTVAGNGTAAYSGDGWPATGASLKNPYGVAVDKDGNIYIADFYNYCIRKVSSDGIITTVAGGWTTGYSGDGGPAVNAKLNYPRGVAVDAKGSLFIADRDNHRIRKVMLPLPDFSDQSIAISSENGAELYQFNSKGRHLLTVDAKTGVTIYTFTYNTAGLLTAVTDRDGNITTIERDTNGYATAIVASGGQRTNLGMDTNGYLSNISNPANERTQFAYTNDGLLTTLTDQKGSIYRFTYDSLGRLTKDENPAGGFSALSRVDSANGYTVYLTTAMNRTNAYSVENLTTGSTRRIDTEPTGLQTTTLTGTDGSKTITSPDGTVTTQVEGPDPRFSMQAPIISSLKITTPAGLISNMTSTRTATLSDQFNLMSLTTLTDTTTINGKTYTNLYDAALKKITSTSPVGRQRFTLLDSLGRVSEEQTTGLNPVSYEYDTQGRLTRVTQGSGIDARTNTISYNALNQISSITDPLFRNIVFNYDSAGRLTRQMLPDGREINYMYDANGNLTYITPPSRPSHAFTYTPVNLEESYTPPDIGLLVDTTLYSYNLDKQMTLITRPDGQTVSLDYDTGGRLSVMTTPTGTTAYSYDSAGHLASLLTQNSQLPTPNSLTYTYDGSLLKGTSWTGSISGNVGFTYNNDFKITSESVNGSNTVSFTYDNDGLLTGTGNLTINRNTQNGLITGTTLGSTTTSQSYNGFGELAQYTANYSGSSIFDVQYTRDSLGRITQKVETVAGVPSTFTYTYDLAGRLTDVTKNGINVGHYEYDSNSNRVSYAGQLGNFAGTYDAQDRLLSYGNNTYTYTANGELVSKTTNGQTTYYSYDVLGNLLSVTLPDGSVIEYVIDGQDRRIGKKVNGVPVQGFLYQNQINIVAELDGAGNIIARFIYGTKTNVPDYMIKSGVTYRIVSDHLGSPIFVIDTSTGTVVQEIDYDEFGNVIQDTNPTFQPFGFAGGIYDQNTKLVRFGARDYNAETGRWTAKDPMRFASGDTNLYGYTLNDPVNFVDPLGLILEICGGKEFKNKVKEVLNTIRETKRGKEIIKHLEKSEDIYRIIETQKDAYYRPKTKEVSIDLNYNPTIETTVGNIPASTERIMAHELGHALGYKDDGPNRMNNVNANENPVAIELGQPRRIRY